jgi:hypothetical protein
MNRFHLLLILMIFFCSMSSCEKDDLCIPEEAATPRLIIIFTDSNNFLIRKPVEGLQVLDRNSENPAPLNADGAETLSQVDSIAIPLRIEPGNSQFSFIRRLNGAVNSDPIDFNYIVGEEYINRACGFKAIYKELTAERPAESPSAPWIRSIIIRDSSVTSNQDIHVEIRH